MDMTLHTISDKIATTAEPMLYYTIKAGPHEDFDRNELPFIAEIRESHGKVFALTNTQMVKDISMFGFKYAYVKYLQAVETNSVNVGTIISPWSKVYYHPDVPNVTYDVPGLELLDKLMWIVKNSSYEDLLLKALINQEFDFGVLAEISEIPTSDMDRIPAIVSACIKFTSESFNLLDFILSYAMES